MFRTEVLSSAASQHATRRTAESSPRRRSRAVAAALALFTLSTASITSAQFCENDGLVVIQVESTPASPGWVEATNSTGYTGSSFYRWEGGNQFNTPGVGVLSYTFNVVTAGTYQMRIRSRNNNALPTEGNDCYTRIDGGDWTKTVSHTNGSWTWSTRFQIIDDTPTFDASYYLNEGLHTFEISARSQDFRIDRVHLYLSSVSDPLNTNKPESAVGGCETATWTPAGYCEQDGLVAFHVESTPAAPGWVEATNSTGYTGSSFYRWEGGDQFNNPGQGVLSYTFTVNTPGRYDLRIRSRNNNPIGNQSNDCFTRIDGGPWIKTVSHVNLVWTWSTRFVLEDEKPTFEGFYNLSAGPHTFEISGRSQDFRIDRVHLYRAGAVDPLNPFLPQSSICENEVGTWTDLGNGLAGALGVPTLAGTGNQTGGDLTTISIANSPLNGAATLVIGTFALNAPFKGGVLVPVPDLLLGGLPLDGAGELEFSFGWPEGLPASTEIYWQAWMQDAGGPNGFSATNGLRSTTP